MRMSKQSIFIVAALLVLLVPLMGVDCDETGDLLRGPESRLLAATVATQITTGVVDAFIIAISDLIFGVGV